MSTLFACKRVGMAAPQSAPDPFKAYEKPALRKLSASQAKLLLLGEASVGNEEAKEILKLFYPDPVPDV